MRARELLLATCLTTLTCEYAIHETYITNPSDSSGNIFCEHNALSLRTGEELRSTLSIHLDWYFSPSVRQDVYRPAGPGNRRTSVARMPGGPDITQPQSEWAALVLPKEADILHPILDSKKGEKENEGFKYAR